MAETIADVMRDLLGNDYLTLFVLSIIPIVEMRGALVIMGGMHGINWFAGLFSCIAGSTVCILPILFLLRPLIRKLKKTKWFYSMARKMEDNIEDRASTVHTGQKVDDILHDEDIKKKHINKDVKKWFGLFLFVAAPLPLTGAWTGSAVGSFLNIKVWKAASAVFLGNIVAGFILAGCVKYIPGEFIDTFLYAFVGLALILCVSLYFARIKRREKKAEKEIAMYGDRNKYELAKLEREAQDMGKAIEKKAFLDDNGEEHVVVGNDDKLNKRFVDKKHQI